MRKVECDCAQCYANTFDLTSSRSAGPRGYLIISKAWLSAVYGRFSPVGISLILLQRMSPLLARLRHRATGLRIPLPMAKRKCCK